MKFWVTTVLHTKKKVLNSLSFVCWRKGEEKYFGIRVLVLGPWAAAMESSFREPEESLGV